MAYAVFPVLLCLETERILINFIVPLSGRKILVWQKGIVYNNTQIIFYKLRGDRTYASNRQHHT